MIHGWAALMGTSQRIPVSFPPFIRDIIKQQVGIIGNSESEVVKNIVLMYLTEKGQLRSRKLKRGGGDQR